MGSIKRLGEKAAQTNWLINSHLISSLMYWIQDGGRLMKPGFRRFKYAFVTIFGVKWQVDDSPHKKSRTFSILNGKQYDFPEIVFLGAEMIADRGEWVQASSATMCANYILLYFGSNLFFNLQQFLFLQHKLFIFAATYFKNLHHIKSNCSMEVSLLCSKFYLFVENYLKFQQLLNL